MAFGSRERRVGIAVVAVAGAAILLGLVSLAPSPSIAESLLSRARLWMEAATPAPDWATLPRGPVLQQAAQRGALVVAVRAYRRPAPPGSATPAGPDNYDAALAQYIGRTLGVPVTIIGLPTPDESPDAPDNPAAVQADLIIGGSRYGIPIAGDELAQSVNQSVATAYASGHAMLVSLRAATLNQPAGHRVCLQQGSPYAHDLVNMYRAKPVAYASSVHAAYAFMSGECEILAEDDAVLKRLMERDDWRFYKPLPVEVQTGSEPQILLSRPDAASAHYLDKVVRRWLASGEQQKARELRAGEVNFEVATLRDGLVCHG